MKTVKFFKTYRFLLIVFSSLLSFQCSNDDSNHQKPAEITYNILPLGASRVEGARPYYESYRYELWKKLIDEDITIDFIGTRYDSADYPAYNDKKFDGDHEGRGGWKSGEIRDGLQSWLAQIEQPDIVLFSSPGANDSVGGIPIIEVRENINEIITILQSEYPNIIIIIEQMAPGRTSFMTPFLENYLEQVNNNVAQIATTRTTTTSKVIAVDMYQGFNDAMLADDTHYNETGAEFIAEKYFEILQDVIN